MVICEHGAFAKLWPCIETSWYHRPDEYGRRHVRGTGRANRRNESSHRVALEEKLGRSLLSGMDACHHCDWKPCIQPEHLYEGTRGQNLTDMYERGRGRWGPDCVKLTVVQQVEARELYGDGSQWSHRALAARFGVSTMQIWRALNDS